MIEADFFAEDERFELLEGWIVRKPASSPYNNAIIMLLDKAIRELLPNGWQLRIKLGVSSTDSETQPDLAAVRGEPRDFMSRHPGPADTALLIEVADSSLEQDRGIKRRLYARAGFPCYWIFNIPDRLVEVNTQPTGPAPSPEYLQVERVDIGGLLPLHLAGQHIGTLNVRDLYL